MDHTEKQEQLLRELGIPAPTKLQLMTQGPYAKLGSDFALLPMTATDILYNLGFAASDTTVQVPQRFLGVTHANLGDWNGQVNWSDQTSPISNFDYLFNMMDDTPAMEEEVVDDMSMTDTSYKSAHSFNTSRGESSNSSFEYLPARPTIKTSGSTSSSGHSNIQQAVVQRTPSVSSRTSHGTRPKMIRSHSLPEIHSKNMGQANKENSSNAEKSYPKTMKLRRHRSQLCLQQSFDTITEEEEDTMNCGSNSITTFEKMETIKGSFSQSVDSVMGAAPVKPSTQCISSNYDLLLENMESSVEIADPFDQSFTETSENATNSISSEKKSAKLKRQSCEEIYQDPLNETPTWEELKSKLEEVERKSWNTSYSLIKERRKMFSKQKGSVSLPVTISQSERVVLPIRRCITMRVEQETETDTSESHSEVSVNIKKNETEPSEQEKTSSMSLPFFESDNDMASATTIDSDSAWFAPSITVEQFGTEESTDADEISNFTSQDGQLTLPTLNGRPMSPALSNASEATLMPEDEEIEQEKMDRSEVAIEKPAASIAVPKQVPRTGRLKKMKSSIIFSSLHDSYNSPFYIYTPKLGFRKRSSSMPLLYKPALVRSKLRRAVTDSPHSLNNIIEEYDADVDDDELMCEQEEWESRIYINILKSITSSSNENLLKQIEDRVEGTSDEALKVKRNGRRKKASFSKSGDEEIPTSSGGENKSDLLAVKPRRKRRKSRDKKMDADTSCLSPAISPYEQTSDQIISDRSSMNTTPEPLQCHPSDCTKPSEQLEPSYSNMRELAPVPLENLATNGSSQGDQDARQGEQNHITTDNDHHDSQSRQAKQVSQSIRLSPCWSLDSKLTSVDKKVDDVKEERRPSAGHIIMNNSDERLSDIIKEDEVRENEFNRTKKLQETPVKSGPVENCNNSKDSLDDIERELEKRRADPDWELKVLRDVIEHFEQDYAKTEKILEEKRIRDKRIRMEIKMLKTQIAVHKMQKRLCSEQFKPVAVSTPRTKPLSNTSTASNQENRSQGQPSVRQRNTLNNFLINESCFIEK